MMDRISDQDLSDLRAAQEMLRQAQAVYAFVSGRVGQRYTLTAQDHIGDDGTIVRASGEQNG
jgi:hypothetical protein